MSASTAAEPPDVIGFFGGSFDPIHLGHIQLARELRERAGLRTLLLCPAHQAPLRDQPHHASPEHRLAMVKAAVGNLPGLEVDDREIRTGGPNYTRDTLRQIRRERPGENLILVLGSDQLAKLPRWRHVNDLVAENEFLVLARPDHPVQAPAALPDLRFRSFPTQKFEHSSTQVRKLIRSRQPYEHLLPEPVAAYVKRHRLYPEREQTTPHAAT